MNVVTVKNGAVGLPGSQRGAVLIVALLVVALVVAMAVAQTREFQLHLAAAENRWHGNQAGAFLDGAESLALTLLEQDRDGSEIDYLGEDWAQQVQPFAVDGGWLQARLSDAQARFNLNSLAGKIEPTGQQGDSEASRFSASQRRFIRLLQSLDEVPVSTDEAIAITEAVVDWQDSDDEITGFGGAENHYYQTLPLAYSVANRPLASVTELRLIKGITAEIYQALIPWVVVLPGATSLNVNTMAAPLLRTLQLDSELLPLSVAAGEAISASREQTGYTTVGKFLQAREIAGWLPEQGVTTEGLSVSSNYFLLQAEARVVRQRRARVTLLQRHNGQVTAIKRESR